MATLILNITDTSLLNLFTALAKRLKVSAKVVKEEKTPNAKTLKAINEVENRIGIIKAKNASELIKKLNA